MAPNHIASSGMAPPPAKGSRPAWPAPMRRADRFRMAFYELTVLRIPREHAALDYWPLFDDDIPVLVCGFFCLPLLCRRLP